LIVNRPECTVVLMKRLLVGARVGAEAWAADFRAALPGHEILTAPPIDGGPVAYAVVGRPVPGLLRALNGLELILSLNAGIEHLLASGEAPDPIPIVRLADHGLALGMTEWVLAQALAWHRNLFDYEASQRAGQWAPRAEAMAHERVAVVLGAGALGAPVALALAAVGFRARIWSRTPRELPGVASFSGPEGLPRAVAGADILVCLLPLTDHTRDILNADVFSRMAPGAFLINGGRGGHVAEADLLAALDAGRLSGAALDVFRAEPLPADHPFWTHPRIRLSPHVAAPTHRRTAVAAMAETVRRHERGEPPLHVVDRALGY
jgi:glyoxylate/hydroxypyruvate reductase A